MGRGVPAAVFVKSYSTYSSVLEALGYETRPDRIVARVARSHLERQQLSLILEAHRKGHLNGEMVTSSVFRRMEDLHADLVAKLSPGLEGPSGSAGGLAEVISGLPEDRRDALADVVLLDGHRGAVKPRKMGVEQFQEVLRQFAGNQTIARQKLIQHLRAELLKRGIDMSCATVEERFRSRPAVRTMPYCVKSILGQLGEEFRTGLVPIEELTGDDDTDAWLTRVQHKLMFRSQSAMHKAIAEATDLSYDCIHKALSGRKKAKRIQIGIKRCLDHWLEEVQEGRRIDVRAEYRGVSVQCVQCLMPALRRLAKTREAVYRAISERTGMRAGSIRRYFQHDGQLKFAPLSVYRVAQALAESAPDHALDEPPARRPRKRRDCESLVAKTRTALRHWKGSKADPELEKDFKRQRRDLIVNLVRQRRAQGVG